MLKKIIYLGILILLFSTISYKDKHTALYQEMRSVIDSIKIIDTHEHQAYTLIKKYNAFDLGFYMYSDLLSSGMTGISDSMDSMHDVDVYWKQISPYLKYVRQTSFKLYKFSRQKNIKHEH